MLLFIRIKSIASMFVEIVAIIFSNLYTNYQKKSIRIVNSSDKNSHTEPIFKSLDVLPLKSLYIYITSVFMLKFHCNLLRPVINELFDWLNSQTARRQPILKPLQIVTAKWTLTRQKLSIKLSANSIKLKSNLTFKLLFISFIFGFYFSQSWIIISLLFVAFNLCKCIVLLGVCLFVCLLVDLLGFFSAQSVIAIVIS